LVWNAYKFYGAIPNIFTPEKVVASKEQANELMMDMFSKYNIPDTEVDKIDEMQANLYNEPKLITSGVVNLISSILLILGAIWMWGMRKKGFFVYLAGNVIGILAPIIIFGGQIGWSFGLMSLVASAIFGGLYAMNLKYLS
jgi:hypothetical protein